MAEIALLSQETIDKIAAGEVIDRPSSVVKELVENSIDAGASAITIEIKDGGISMIRITDNGCGIEKNQVSLAFLRHSTSKIKSVEDLLSVSSLGFRGEALSSIAAVSQVELITKVWKDLTGIRYVIEGSREISREEIGAPDGTTFLVRNLFYNTPARRKFLKTPQTEGGYIHTLVERLALSHPEISFKLIINNQPKLHTSGNSNPRDVIYQIYGREITASLLEIKEENSLFSVTGFIGKPEVSRGNRNFENYFINQRYIKSALIAKGIEDGYKSFLMQHQYPFCVLYFTFQGEMLDVNVHPSKMELRFSQNEGIYQSVYDCVRNSLAGREHIRTVSFREENKRKDEKSDSPGERPPEPFEKKRMEQEKVREIAKAAGKDSPYEPKYGDRLKYGQRPQKPDAWQNIQKEAGVRQSGQNETDVRQEIENKADVQQEIKNKADVRQEIKNESDTRENSRSEPAGQKDLSSPGHLLDRQEYVQDTSQEYVQEELQYEGRFLSEQSRKFHKVIGQVFDTYWLVEYDGKLFIIDQHAAHEKVLYERAITSLKKKEFTSQMLSPPVVLSLDTREEAALKEFGEQLCHLGFQIEHFGGKEYALCGVPDNLFSLDAKQILLEILDGSDELHKASTPELVLEKIASMSCKGAVKGSHTLSKEEAGALISELLELENPYFCPHGRPTIISMSKYELEKKFKRIV